MKRVNYLKLSVSVVIVFVVYSFLLVLLVRIESNEPHTTIHNFSDGVWFLVATLTSVGYGDATPASLEGRIIGGFFLLTSLALYGFIIGQIASFMNTLKE